MNIRRLQARRVQPGLQIAQNGKKNRGFKASEWSGLGSKSVGIRRFPPRRTNMKAFGNSSEILPAGWYPHTPSAKWKIESSTELFFPAEHYPALFQSWYKPGMISSDRIPNHE
ncbi:MAG TPA: hypothetical protein VJ385_02210 [Fibrobacteria bacterium]|nr:hypothetical protein [Fibrobacteria bacterium]